MSTPRRGFVRGAVTVVWLAVIAALIGLGTWQVQRRAWKLDLIARVDARVHAAPVAAPATAGKDDAYRRVRVTGDYLSGRDTFVQASTVRGPGFWAITPLRRGDGSIVLINRGYVPARAALPPVAGTTTITGLLRLTEPGGGFLRSNVPATDRWYSRDVAAIATRRAVSPALPYFIDADASDPRPGAPVGGLTVIHFPNSHLAYAVTWYILALMGIAGLIYWIRVERQRHTPAA
ncbi:SURF1 family protein [Sphingomonas sp. PAMC 26617]|uniref:SURF1 family protein n=1 Tax=Sphingomonas sp. PAMC 26617 TaxID=1112216 RepID=UPI00056A82A6|nr:SURF1 family protein [Sphingomonas sp. PAMC 26617]